MVVFGMKEKNGWEDNSMMRLSKSTPLLTTILACKCNELSSLLPPEKNMKAQINMPQPFVIEDIL